MVAALESLPDDLSALKAIILSQHQEITRLSATGRALEALVQEPGDLRRAAIHFVRIRPIADE